MARIMGLLLIASVASAQITPFAGGGNGDGGPAINAVVDARGVAVSPGGILIVDGNGARLRFVNAAGIISTVAGTGVAGFSGDGGPATAAQLNFPTDACLDGSGALLISDTNNNRVRRVLNGTISTFAGNGNLSSTGDGGPATLASLNAPRGVAVDTAGNVYISEFGGNRVRKVSGGIITTFAGTGAFGFSGDGGPATAARLFSPLGMLADAGGNLYISDANNNRIRKVNAAGIINTVVGTGTGGYSGDGGPALSAQIRFPQRVALDSAGNLLVLDSGNLRLRSVNLSGIISTAPGNQADGTWSTVANSSPVGLAAAGMTAYVAVNASSVLDSRVFSDVLGSVATPTPTATGTFSPTATRTSTPTLVATATPTLRPTVCGTPVCT